MAWDFLVAGPVGPRVFRVALNFLAEMAFFLVDSRSFWPTRIALWGFRGGGGKNVTRGVWLCRVCCRYEVFS